MIFSLIDDLTEKQSSEINAFLETHPKANYFQSPVLFKVCQQSGKLSPYFFLVHENKRLVASMLVVKQVQLKLPGLRYLTSRNVISGGPLIADDDIGILRFLLQEYTSNKPSAIYSQIRNFHSWDESQLVFSKGGFQFKGHLNILIDLNKSEEELWEEVHTKRRNEIRKAKKEGSAFRHDNSSGELKAAYEILAEVYSRAKLPLPAYAHFESLLEHKCLEVFVAKFGDKTIGCMLCIPYRGVLYDYFAGAFSRFYNKYPNDLITWEVMLWAKNNHFHCFDFGGAGDPDVYYGVREYKKKFGGEIVNYGRFESIHSSFLFKLASWGFKLLQKIKK